MSQRGKTMLLVDGYRFSQKRVVGVKTHWLCSSGYKNKCRAMVHTINDLSFVVSKKGTSMIKDRHYTFFKKKAYGCKWHWACSTHHNKGCRAVIHTVDDKGSKLLEVNGYTFFRKSGYGLKTYWACSTHHNKGCNAIIHTVDDDIVTKAFKYHNH
ncbi:unnamed protein product [Leptidea sinapis]|uniref:FLYWCH-type domain-containing protein n=1 Tax=Leptidea sinapis TaxID=189913 RepID=A0A5E4PZI7_9NEOP|nr:unnamed protein product [Leptidea sinapis]